MMNDLSLNNQTKNRVRSYFSIGVLVILLIVLVSGFIQTRNRIYETQLHLSMLQSAVTEHASFQIENFVDRIVADMNLISKEPSMVYGGLTEDYSIQLNKLITSNDSISELTAIGSDGQVVVGVSRTRANVATTEYFKDAPFFKMNMNGRLFIDKVYFVNNSEPFMKLAVPIIPVDGLIVGSLVAEINLKHILSVVADIKVGDTGSGSTYVVESSGRLIAHPDISLVLLNTDTSALPQIKAVFRERRFVKGFESVNITGEKVYTSTTYLKSVGWAVVVEEPLRSAYSKLYGSIIRNVLLLLASLVVVSTILFFLARRILLPLNLLKEGVEKIGNGNFYHRVQIHTGDEFESLAASINSMAGALGESYRTLERRVEERTQELTESNTKLDEISRYKSDFLANMSHELRTPLNAIIGYSEMLEEDLAQADEALLSDVKNINTSGRNLLALINDILDIAKIESGKMELFIEEFSIADLMAEIETLVFPVLQRNVNKLVIENTLGFDSMRADQLKIRQILLNIITNAAKFTHNGVIDTTVSSFTDKSEVQWLEFVIADTGIGMAPEQLDLIFEAFTQASKITTTKFGGTGLGLTISKQFCCLMGGDIHVSSSLNQGSMFTVRIPRSVTEPDAANSLDSIQSTKNLNSAAAVALVECYASDNPDNLPLVLVIDDDLAVHDILKRRLHKQGYRIVSAFSGADGIALAKRIKPVLITLDIILPDIDGWEVLYEIRSDEALKYIPVIMLSVVESHERGIALGADSFLVKPVDQQKLIDIFSEVVANTKL